MKIKNYLSGLLNTKSICFIWAHAKIRGIFSTGAQIFREDKEIDWG